MENPKTIEQSDNLQRAAYLTIDHILDFITDLIQVRKGYAEEIIGCKPENSKYLLLISGINKCDNELRKLLAINLQPLDL